jgi:hypothetical protein
MGKRKRWKGSLAQRQAWSRKYDALHRRRREIAAVQVAKGEAVCWRCELPIDPSEPWELGHDDDGREHKGPEPRYCNRAAAGRATRKRHERRTSVRLD